MALDGAELRSTRASFGSAAELCERRRSIYRLTLETAPGRADGEARRLPPAVVARHDVLDNPVVRAHLGGVLGGTAAYDPRRVRPLGEWADVLDVGAGGHHDVHVVARPDAAPALDPALARIGVGLGRSDLGADASALVMSGTDSFVPARERLAEGVRLALDVAPELVGDLLPHVALFAVVRATVAGRLGSASSRDFPGLIVLPEPRSALEVAEALVHEGAHVKFFDMAMTCSLLAAGCGSVWFRPPWAALDAAAWPFEQTMAAFHAYCCLAAFHEALPAHGKVSLDDHSLLPLAAERATVIGRFLLGCGGQLGPDGQALVERLTGRGFTVPAARTDAADLVGRAARADPSVLSRNCGAWTLLMRWTNPVSLAWIPSAQLV